MIARLSRRSFALLASLSLLACGGDKTQPRAGATAASAPAAKTFSYARLEAFKNLDPVKQFDGASSELVRNLYDGLLAYAYLARPLQLEPNLVSSVPQPSADGLRYAFELRGDVRFNDDACFPGGKGRLLNADDVIYSLKRYADANLNGLSDSLLEHAIKGMDEFRDQTRRLGKATDYAKLPIAGITKQDDRRFTIELNRPNPRVLLALATTPLSIVPREAVEHYQQEFEQHPVGSGPFWVKQMSRRGVIVLAKNPHYHRSYPSEGEPGDAERGLLRSAGQRLPLVDEVQLPLMEEAQPRMLKFLGGRLDWVPLDRDNFSNMALKDASGFHLKPEYARAYRMYSQPDLRIEGLFFNMTDALIGKNKPLRQAIAYALDTAAFLSRMYNGRGELLKTIVPLALPGSERDVPARGRTHDAALAQKKLAEAGYPAGKGLPPISIDYRSSTTLSRSHFEFQRAQLARFGIVLQANFQSFSAWLKKIEAGNFQIADFGWSADYPDAENFYQLLYSKNRPPGPNYGSYENAAYDALFEQIHYLPNGSERYALFGRMNDIVEQDAPIVFLWNLTRVGLHQAWVDNFKYHVLLDLPFMYFDVDPKAKARAQ
jgi:oligopeptide transport system substrate-binding protein